LNLRQPVILTDGNPARGIILFTLPIFAGDFLNTFYLMADAFIVGRWLGIDGLAAVGAGGSLVQFVFSFAIGLTGGFVVITTQRVGERNQEGIRRSVAAGLQLSLVSAAILMIVLLPLAPHILAAMQTPAQIIDGTLSFVTITISGIVVYMAFFMLSGIIQAGGNSMIPFIFMIIANICNIILDIIFIVVFSWGIRGVASATLISEFIAAVLCAVYLFRHFRSFLPQ